MYLAYWNNYDGTFKRFELNLDMVDFQTDGSECVWLVPGTYNEED